MTDTEKAALEARIDELCAEVERLRSVVSDGADNARELRAENAKLRGLCRKFAEYLSKDRCEGCVVKRRCNEGDVEECWQRTEIRKVASELGIEVDG